MKQVDHLREIAEDLGLDTSWSEDAWPNFLRIFNSYMMYRNEYDLRHASACIELRIDKKSSWRDLFSDLYDSIMDDPSLYY